MEKLYNVKECSQILRISIANMWGLVRKGKIEIVRIGGRVVISEIAVEKFIEERRIYTGRV